VLGAALMAAGHFMMAFEPLFLLALTVLILGNGAFKPNISTQVGALYPAGDPRRDRAFSIFYVGINLGAFFSPLVCGTLGETLGWHYGFAAAGVGMTIGLAIYLYASRTLPPDERSRVLSAGKSGPFGRDDWRAMGAIVLLGLPVTLLWAAYEQSGNTIMLWADGHTDRSVNVLFWTAQIPATWFNAVNPFMIFAFTPFVLALWRTQAARGREPPTIVKLSYGCFFVGAAYLIMMAAAVQAGTGTASWLWLMAFFVVLTIGELYLSPTSLSLVTKVAPARAVSMMMGVWLATIFVGNLVGGYLGSFWSSMDKMNFFLMIAIIAASAGLAVLAIARPLRAILRD
jgi:POT family proton-dependent oligopeptide transporter